MIVRYRDGAVPAGDARPGAGRGLRRAADERVAELVDRAELTAGARGDLAARAAAEPLRRGAGAVEAGQGRGARRPTSTACWRSLAEGLRVVTCCCAP